MSRVRLIERREDASATQTEVFDHIAASRGSVAKPFAALLHKPDLARAAADLGAVIRYGSKLSDHDRELVICATVHRWSCDMEWDAHLPMARSAGVSDQTLRQVEDGSEISDHADSELVGLVREMTLGGPVSDATFRAIEARFGEAGAVELAATVGYYTMLALFMSACGIC